MPNRNSAFIEGGGRSRAPYKIDPETGKRIEWAASKKPGQEMQKIATNRRREQEIGNAIGNALLGGKVKVGDKEKFWGSGQDRPEGIKESLAKDFGGRPKSTGPKNISSVKNKKKAGGLLGAIKRRLGI